MNETYVRRHQPSRSQQHSQSQPEVADGAPLSFLSLPAELRNIIYDYCLSTIPNVSRSLARPPVNLAPLPRELKGLRPPPQQTVHRPQDLRPYLNLLQANSQIRFEIMPIFYKEHLANVFIHLELDFNDGPKSFQRFQAICAWATSVRADMRIQFLFSTRDWHRDLIQRFQHNVWYHIWNLQPPNQTLGPGFQASENKPVLVMPPGFAMQQTRPPHQLAARYLWITGPLATIDWSRFQFDFETRVLIDVEQDGSVFWSEAANNGGWVRHPFNNDRELIELDSEDERDRSGGRNQPIVLGDEESLIGRSTRAGRVARVHEVIEIDSEDE